MISKKEFIEIINEYKTQHERLDKLSDAGFSIWDTNVIDYGNIMFDHVINISFTEEGIDWVYWWLCEKDGNPQFKAWDEDHTEIPMDTVEELWEYIKQYRQ